MIAPGPTPTILVIDDDETVLHALRAQLLRELGGQVFVDTTTSGEEAIEMAAEYRCDGVPVPLVLCDEIMPGMRGHLVLRELHRRLPQARTILLTGQADLASVTAAVNDASLYRYIAKPWEQVDLLLTVRAALEAWTLDRERERRMAVFHAFVPEAFLRILGLDDPAQSRLGLSRTRELTVLFADIRDFTTLSERLGSEGTFRFLNSCFSALVPLIADHGGVVDKYIGDALLALFPEPAQAVEAASAMVARAALIEAGAGMPAGDVRIGIGLNTGDLILGTVGVPERLQTTVIGDVVNTAARIEGLTKELGTAVLLAESTAARTERPTRCIGRFALRGKGRTVALYQLLDDLDPAERSCVDRGREAFETMILQQAEDEDGVHLLRLRAYVAGQPLDRVAQALLARAAPPASPGA